MFDRLAPLAHGMRIGIEPLLHSFEYLLVLPARDASLRSCRAVRLERTFRTRCCPVAPQLFSILLVGVPILETLAGWAAIDVLLRQVDKVLLAEPPCRLGSRGHRFRQRHRDASLVAFQNLGAVEV